MRKIVIFEQVNLLTHLCLVEMPVKCTQSTSNFCCFPYHFFPKLLSFLSLHEIYDFLRGNLCIIEGKRIAHGVLADEIKSLEAFNVVLLVDEEIKLLPLFSNHLETRTLENELTQSLQDANVNTQALTCSSTPAAHLQHLS